MHGITDILGEEHVLKFFQIALKYRNIRQTQISKISIGCQIFKSRIEYLKPSQSGVYYNGIECGKIVIVLVGNYLIFGNDLGFRYGILSQGTITWLIGQY
jgi:hypothetical protein